MIRLWRWRWGLARLILAVVLLWVVAADAGPRLARLRYRALPDFDYAAEVAFLRDAGRYGEALIVAEAGLEATEGEAMARLEREREATTRAQSSWLRRARDAGWGAISGQGTSIESLIGAVAADFFVVGDVRDLVIQSGRYVADGEADPVILALSGLGVATTVAPEIDWAPSILKAARKAGAMSRGLADRVVVLVRTGAGDGLNAMMRDAAELARRASPGGAARMLRHADGADDLAVMARFVRTERAGAFAMHVTGREGLRLARAGGDEAKLAVMAARKGNSGVAWLRTSGARALMRPHPIIGVAKAVWKGDAARLATALAREIDPRARWLLPLLAAWVFVEGALLARRLMRRGQGQPAAKTLM
ncbi:MAG: hypothetical protein ACKVW3_15785 [Phycisphaerales bacterium]